MREAYEAGRGDHLKELNPHLLKLLKHLWNIKNIDSKAHKSEVIG